MPPTLLCASPRLLCILVFALLTAACGGAGVEVHNQSAARLEDIVVFANGKSVSLGSIAPQAHRRTSICPQGEAGKIGLSFRANGQTYLGEPPAYFECDWMYVVRVDVTPAMQVTATARLR